MCMGIFMDSWPGVNKCFRVFVKKTPLLYNVIVAQRETGVGGGGGGINYQITSLSSNRWTVKYNNERPSGLVRTCMRTLRIRIKTQSEICFCLQTAVSELQVLFQRSAPNGPTLISTSFNPFRPTCCRSGHIPQFRNSHWLAPMLTFQSAIHFFENVADCQEK